ncbi:hypothetical protein [Kribbella pratensis]|uniref:hypothetical protein n=1 Tax=Kribbella pratensis TaxID=2512112 RepID=UPI00106717EA|nr:hypothetical protein [Kribbella pratensis]
MGVVLLAALLLLLVIAAVVISSLSGQVSASLGPAILSIIGVLIGAVAAAATWWSVPSRTKNLAETRTSASGLLADSAIEFLGQWQQFERTLRSVTSEVPNEGAQRRRTLSEDIRLATNADLIHSEEIGDVRRLLATRNDLVHGGVVDDPAALADDSDRLATIVRRMIARAAAMDAAGGKDL